MPSLFHAVIFDFDYTLADSSPGIITCTNYALTHLGLPEAPQEAILPLIGLSLPAMFARLAGERPGADEFTRLFIQRADEVMVDQTTLFTQVPAMVSALVGCGLRLGIVSTKYRRRIATVLEREGLHAAFDVIVGGDDVATHKPDPEGLLLAMQRLGPLPASTLYVGDSATDAEAAQRARVAFVAVLSGVTPRESFAAYPAYAVLPDVAALPDLLVC